MNLRTLLPLSTLLLVVRLAPAQLPGFTYQGRLTDNGTPANGLYDLRFTLYDSLIGGGLRGGPITVAPVPVSNGLFTVSLNFGNAFNSVNSPTLAIEVRPNGSAGAYTPLAPRQPVTPAPYALRAFTADILGGLDANAFWKLSGNGGTTPGANFLGTTDNQPLMLKGGFVGVGRSTQITSAEYFGVNASAPAGGFGGMYVNTVDAGGRPFYGYSQSGGARAFHYVDGNDGNKWKLNVNSGVRLTVTPDGLVGIGATSPQLPLQISQAGPYGRPAAGAVNGSAWLYLLADSSFHHALIWDAARDLRFGTETGIGTGYSESVRITANGNVGIGTAVPQGKLDINTGNGNVQFIDDFVPGLNVTGGSLPGIMRFRNALEIWPSQDGSRSGYLDVRGTDGSPTIALNGASGEATVKVLNITGGADVAEPFQISGPEIPKGAVVVIDEENPGRLKQSDRAYDTRVAGIVSGANGVNPGIALHQQGVLEGGQNVALTGRVYALADASEAAIKPGDLLTTSGVPGHAMRAVDPNQATGAILGKAMTGLKEGKGYVLVLVSLQ